MNVHEIGIQRGQI